MANYTATTNPLQLRITDNVTVRAVFSLAPPRPSATPAPSPTPSASPRATPAASPQPSPTPLPSPTPSVTPPILDRTFIASITPQGAGTIITPTGAQSTSYVTNTRPATQIALTAVPATGWQFFRWENRVNGVFIENRPGSIVGSASELFTVQNTRELQSDENTWFAVFTPIPSTTPPASPPATPPATPPASPLPPEVSPFPTPSASPIREAAPLPTPPASPLPPAASPLPPAVSPLPPAPSPAASPTPLIRLTFQVQSVPGTEGVGGSVKLPDGRNGTFFIETLALGTRLSVIAIANEGWRFAGWTKLVNSEFTTPGTSPTLDIEVDTAATYYPTFVKEWRSCIDGAIKQGTPPAGYREVVYPGAGGGFCFEPASGVGFNPGLDGIKFRYQRGTSVYPDPMTIEANNSSYAVAYKVKMKTNSNLFEIVPAERIISPRETKIFTIQPKPALLPTFGDGTTTFRLEVETTPA